MERLYGRDRIFDFAGAALRYRVLGRPLPVLLLSGPRGSGGSALLAGLREKFGNDGPFAHLNVADAEEIADVMLTAMPGLRRHVLGIRQLEFPRLRLAVKALSFNGDDRESFDKYMRAGGRAARASSALPGWITRVAALLPLPPDQRLYAEIAARLLNWALPGIAQQRERAVLRWFAEESDVAGGSGFDPLWRLYHWQREKDEDKRYKADKTLCDAFLTDMRTDYNDTGLKHGRRKRNPALVLDNADSRTGIRLLELLEACRRESDRGIGTHADPLLVVAVQRRPPSPEKGTPIQATDKKLDFAQWCGTVDAADHLILWYPVYLSPLGDGHVATMASSRVLGISPYIHRDADFVRALTGGHPEATARLSRLLRELDSGTDPRLLLDQHIPPVLRDEWQAYKADTTVGDYLLMRAFADDLRMSPDGGIDADGNAMLDAMAVGAATPGFRLGACQAVFNSLQWTATAVDARDRLTETMWLARPGETMWLAEPGWLPEPGDGVPRLHPLAALLLRRWLARKHTTWAEVHEGYVTHYSDPDTTALRHHHKLAIVAPGTHWAGTAPEAGETVIEPSRMDQLAEVVTFLDKEWESSEGRTRDWLGALNTVVAAPNRLRTAHRPEVFVRALAGPEEPGNRRQIIARLAVGRWLFNDRLFDPTRQLARLVADEYHYLSQVPGGDGDLLLEEEAKYRKIQREWED